MVAQVYETNRYTFLETTHPDYTPTSYEFFLGEFSPYTKLYDPNNEFTSLGGSKENPLIYTYQNTGITEFTINIISPTWINQSEVYPAYAFYELFIDGDKQYYFWNGPDNYKLYNLVCPVKATIGQTTKFKMRVTITSESPSLLKYYFEGDPDTVYSSITAKFITDAAPVPSGLPIVYLSSPQPLTSNTISVFTSGSYSYPLPAISSVNDILELKMAGADSYTITQAEGQKISVAGIESTVGTGGSMLCNGGGDWIRLVCTEANKSWMEIGMSGDSFIVT